MRYLSNSLMPIAVAALALGSFCLQPAFAEDRFEAEIAVFDAFVEREMEVAGLPGLAVAVRYGDWVWARGYGLADVENELPTRAESAYRLASVTKPMTAVGILELVEDGKVDLDAEVQTYVPYFPQKEHPVTVRQLLGHIGGISHYRDYDLEGHFKDHKTTAEAIAVFADFELIAEPGTRYNYSSYGYNLLGAVIEAASGMSYGDFMSQRVWQPMGMESIRMDDPTEIIPNRVRGYRRTNGELENSEFVDISSRFAAGGTRATVLDLIKFTQGLEENVVLEPEATRLMLRSLATADRRFTDYGMGWGVYPLNGRPRFTHSGGQAETSTRLTWMPTEQFTIAMASNLEGADLQAYQEKLLRLFFDETWNVRAYVPGERERAIYYAMAGAYGAGTAEYLTEGSAPADPEAVKAAFVGFRKAIDPKAWQLDSEATRDWLRNGRHPATNEALVKMGRQMTAVLAAADNQHLTAIHRGGELAFFRAYMDHYRTHRGVPRTQRFPKAFEQLVESWSDAWTQVWTTEMRSLQLVESTGFAEIQDTLRQAFDGAAIVPNYAPDLVNMAEDAFLRGDQTAGFNASQLAIELYSESEAANGLWGAVMILGGNIDVGRQHLAKAVQIAPDGFAGAGNLANIAEFMRQSGNLPAAQALLEAATELHPEDVETRKALAELDSED